MRDLAAGRSRSYGGGRLARACASSTASLSAITPTRAPPDRTRRFPQAATVDAPARSSGWLIQWAVAVDKLIEQLGTDLEGYATYRKFPRKLRLDEASEVAAFVHEQVDAGVEARAAAVAQSGEHIACKRGCNGCCEEPIMIFRPEAARVWRWLERPENKETRLAFLAAYPQWKAKIGKTVDRLSELFETDSANYVQHHVDAWREGVLCPFNRDGDCTVYPVRPTICRTGHALETNANCSGSAEAPAKRATFVPLDDFVARTRWLMTATHNATGGTRGRPQALPHAVHALLRG
jgi:Fe-S-cluster containining protein